MGQTLSHGVYLPNEGERNCYAGLASNWQILNTAVGAISEKAPLVHTHTVSQITDFPAYGNAAGTICEGNDSRLSDARTPVAHTHGKADITDLFNSANVWSGYNTFTSYITLRESAAIPAGGYGKGVAFQDYQSNRLGYIQPYLTSDNAKRLIIGADSGDVAISSSLIPHVNNAYNLGTSTNKWKTLNGINPGALSLPNVNAVTGSSNTQLQDISGDLVQDQYFNCYFTPRMDGWAYIALNCSNATIRSGFSSYTVSVKTARSFANSIYTQSFTKNENAFPDIQIFIPVTANKEMTLECSFTGFSVTKGYVIPCLGNV